MGKRNRDKRYYAQSAKRAKLDQFNMGLGQRGFLLFHGNRDREALREGFALLNEFADNVSNTSDSQVMLRTKTIYFDFSWR